MDQQPIASAIECAVAGRSTQVIQRLLRQLICVVACSYGDDNQAHVPNEAIGIGTAEAQRYSRKHSTPQ
jgi:hypothetical protein